MALRGTASGYERKGSGEVGVVQLWGKNHKDPFKRGVVGGIEKRWGDRKNWVK